MDVNPEEYKATDFCDNDSEWVQAVLGLELKLGISQTDYSLQTTTEKDDMKDENAKNVDLSHDGEECNSLPNLQSYEIDGPQNDIPDSTQLLGWDCTSYFSTDNVFYTRDELTAWAKAVGRTCGVVVGIRKSDNPKYGRRGRITYCCERSGPYRQNKNKTPTAMKKSDGKKQKSKDEKVVKSTGTKKCMCPFLLKGVKLPEEDQWKIEVVCGKHNHHVDKNTTFEGHSFVGRLSKDEEQVVADMSICGVKPKEILRVIKQTQPYNASTIGTIYNYRAKHRIAEKQGRTQMQQLMHLLDDKRYVEFHRKNDVTDEVVDIFFAHPYAVQLVKCFPHVLLMDCTYKTNRHDMPLLEIVGVTSTWKTFIVAHAFLNSEREDNFSWVLRCLKEMFTLDMSPSVIVTDRELALMKAISGEFPEATHLLCTWHISKNIQAHGKKTFNTMEEWEIFIQDFNVVISESTEQSFDAALMGFKVKYANYNKLLDYIDDTWLSPYKQRFVAAWTNRIMHFGNLTTNRVESQHASLKKYLGSSRGDLVGNFKQIDNLLIVQHVAVRASFRKSLSQVAHAHRIAEFKFLRGYVSIHAIELLFEERERGQDIGIDISQCGCVLKYTHGLPCAHEIVQFQREGRGIPLSAIYPMWRKLNDIPWKIPNCNVDCELEISLFRQRFDRASEEQKYMMLKYLREVSNPATTNMAPPSRNRITKGRPIISRQRRSAKLKDSTKRDPSAFEYAKTKEEVLSQQSVCKTSFANKPKHNKRKKTLGCDMTDEQFNESVLYEYNHSIREHVILRLEDVAPDGHCGYRCCAEMLNFRTNDGWKLIRQGMLEELNKHKELYIGMLGEQIYNKVGYALNYFGEFASRHHWMQFPDMGCLFDSAFNCILCVFSPQQCITYLPLRMAPSNNTSMIVSIVLVNDKHFMKVALKPESPIPPIVPGWKYQRYPDAYSWTELLHDRLLKWNTLNCHLTVDLPSIQDSFMHVIDKKSCFS